MMKNKTYRETLSSLKWLAKNVPKQKESEFIREAVKEKIQKKLSPRKKIA